MNRDLLICFFSASSFFTFCVISPAQEQDTPPPVDEATSLDVTTVESSPPVRSVVIRQEAAQQLYTPSVVTKTLLSDEQAERTLLPAVDTISGAEIRTFQRYDIGDILSQTAGVNLVEAGQAGAQTSLFIRGMESNHAVVLLNGRRLPPGLAGIYQLEYLDVSTLESVQVTKGASSSLYGSDALAGVIDMRSADARYLEADTLSSYLEGGSFATIRTGHKLTIKDGPVAVAIDTSALETANDRASSDFENALLRGNVAVELGEGSYFDILGYIQDSFIQVPGSSLSPFFPEQQINKNRSTLFSPRFSIVRGDWDFSTFYSHTANELEARKDTFFNDNLLEQTGHEVEAVINFRPNEETAYTLGAGYYGYEFERTPIIPGPFNLPSKFGFSYTSVFAQTGINLPEGFTILTSARYDEHDSFTSKGTYTAPDNPRFRAHRHDTFCVKAQPVTKPPRVRTLSFLILTLIQPQSGLKKA